jgi:hypothetical protein
MIQYRITLEELKAEIEKVVPGWLLKAEERTKKFRKQKTYDEASSIWSQVKPVYMRLQGDCKCAFCERKMESITYGKSEEDVEHFRPKGNVRAWELPEGLKGMDIQLGSPPKKGGYYLLPYHPFNYSAACKPCNSELKKDLFPVAGTHQLNGEDPKTLMAEKPYLIYPIGDLDEPAENLIKFEGPFPQPTASTGHNRKRALVTIEFFKLDAVIERKNLITERVRTVVGMYYDLQIIAGEIPGDQNRSQGNIKGFTSLNTAHSNCANSFKRLFEQDRVKAKSIYEAASDYLQKNS